MSTDWKFKRNGQCIAPDGTLFARINRLVWGNYEIKYLTLDRNGGAHYHSEAKQAVKQVYALTTKRDA